MRKGEIIEREILTSFKVSGIWKYNHMQHADLQFCTMFYVQVVAF